MQRMRLTTKLTFYKHLTRYFTMTDNNYEDILKKLSIDDKALKSLMASKKLSQFYVETIQAIGMGVLEKKQGNLMNGFLSTSAHLPKEQVQNAAKYIIDGRFANKVQIEEATKYLSENNNMNWEKEDDIKQFEEATGVGLEYTGEQIEQYVSQFIEQNKAEIETNPNSGSVLFNLRAGLKFADQGKLIGTYKKLTKGMGTQNKDKKKAKKQKEPKKVEEEEEVDTDELVAKYKLEKLIARNMAESLNTPEIMEKHRQAVGDTVITRFPPEPNGYLHIGHCKAMRFNFKVAADHGGYTNLRYDDTNPEAESQEYIDKIKENVLWMGYKPKNVLFASDYFDQIYEAAVELIKQGKAFVCKLSKEDSKKKREAGEPSPFRDLPVEESLAEFDLMKSGYYAEGEACLRAKIDYNSKNPNMRDPVIYRIKYVPHPHVGDKWCIYPLYDFVHSISDSIENITHSLCTLEFENRRELYYWNLNELDWYKPYVWEYSRLNLSHNVLSKRKVLMLVNGGHVSGWDDPRLLTIEGIKRRGYPPQAINDFCDLISVTRRGNDNILSYSILELAIRNYLSKNSKNTFAVVDPVPVTITNVTEPVIVDADVLSLKLQVTRDIYVDAEDVRENDDKKFFGIAPGKTVRLRYGPFIKVDTVTNENGSLKVTATLLKEGEIKDYKKVKGILHWLSKEDSTDCEIREYDRLFLTEFPGKKTGNIMDDFNKDSRLIYNNSKIHKDFAAGLNAEDRWQFERRGYFCLDYDSDVANAKYVFNRTVSMKSKKKEKAFNKK